MQKHIDNVQKNNGIYNIPIINKSRKIYTRNKIKEDNKYNAESKTDESESETNDEVNLDDCSANTISMMKIYENSLTSKLPKYFTPMELHDYAIIDKILTKQSVQLNEFTSMYNRLGK